MMTTQATPLLWTDERIRMFSGNCSTAWEAKRMYDVMKKVRDDYIAALAQRDAEIASLKAQVSELEAHIVIDRGVYNRLCTLQAIMSHPTATPTTEEFDEYCGLLELVFHKHEKDGDE